jgi:hypothetical protein
MLSGKFGKARQIHAWFPFIRLSQFLNLDTFARLLVC